MALLGILESLMATVLNSNFGPWRVATGENHEKVGIIDQLGRPCLHFEEDGHTASDEKSDHDFLL